MKIKDSLLGLNDQIPRRIHILGSGDIGHFIAHAIARIPCRPPVTLIFRTNAKFQKWQEADCSIEVVTDSISEKQSGFEIEVLPQHKYDKPYDAREVEVPQFFSSSGDRLDPSPGDGYDADQMMISQLIVNLKAPFVVRALSQVAGRLSSDSTVAIFQHGLGVIDDLNEKVFPDQRTRPTYILGISNHLTYRQDFDGFSLTHGRMGTTALGVLPRHSMLQPWTKEDFIQNMAPSARYLLQTLTRTPILAAAGFTPTQIVQYHLEKLAVSAIINPLCVIFDCRFGDLFLDPHSMRLARLLAAEISLVIRSLPELQGVPNVTVRFGPDAIEQRARTFSEKKADRFSTMLQQVKDRRATEVSYINGYIVRRGEQLGIKCLMNYMIMQMVKGKVIVERNKPDEFFPLELPFEDEPP